MGLPFYQLVEPLRSNLSPGRYKWGLCGEQTVGQQGGGQGVAVAWINVVAAEAGTTDWVSNTF